MKVFGILLLCIAICSKAEETLSDDVDEQGFIQAVLDGVDNNRSFSENFFSLLRIICPESIYCNDKNSSEEWFLDDVNNETNLDTKLSHSHKSDVITNARKILESNVHKLKGCCGRCECENDCVERRNCCPAATEGLMIGSGDEDRVQVTQDCVSATIQSYLPNRNTWAATKGTTYFMVTDCFSLNFSQNIADKCREPDPKNPTEAVPVYSYETDRIYKNKFCAECNNNDEVTTWLPVIKFPENVAFFDTMTDFTPATIYAMILRSRNILDLHFIPPPDLPMERKNFFCNPADKYLAANCGKSAYIDGLDVNQFFERACAKQEVPFHTFRRTYKNVFCFLCSNIGIYGAYTCSGMSREDKYPFTAILRSYDKLRLEVQQGHADGFIGGLCKCTEYYDEKKKTCRKLLCPPGEVFVECACLEYLISYQEKPINIYLQVTPLDQRSHTLKRLSNQLNKNKGINTFTAKINNAIALRWGPLEFKFSILFRQISATDTNYIKIHVLLGVVFISKSYEKNIMKDICESLESGISVEILDIPMEVSFGPRLSLMSCSVSAPFNMPRDYDKEIVQMTTIGPQLQKRICTRVKTTQTLNKLMFCRRINLEEDELTTLRNGSLNLAQAYLDNVFWERDVSMCHEDFKKLFSRKSSCTKTFPNPITTVYMLATYLLYRII